MVEFSTVLPQLLVSSIAAHRCDDLGGIVLSTGLVYMQARYYDPAIHRFISPDPIYVDLGSGANFNRYRYANNSPYSNIDRSGRNACPPDEKGCIDSPGTEFAGLPEEVSDPMRQKNAQVVDAAHSGHLVSCPINSQCQSTNRSNDLSAIGATGWIAAFLSLG